MFSFEDARTGRLPQSVRFMLDAVFRTPANAAYPQGIPLREIKYLSGLDASAVLDVF